MWNMKQEVEDLKTEIVHWWFWSIYKTMFSYFLKCRKNTENKIPKVVKTKNGRIMLLSKYVLCDSKKLII